MEFESFQKIDRLFREIIITEKIDGTNGQIAITPDGKMFVGSRSRWITPQEDNYGFAAWAYENKEELLKLGPGRHFGEWWGSGIQRKYGLTEKRFSLFNVSRWSDDEVRPKCCYVVPLLYKGDFYTTLVEAVLDDLLIAGSKAAPGFMSPEGVIVYHVPSNNLYKATIEDDDKPKQRRRGR
jgi:hypothetical protein